MSTITSKENDTHPKASLGQQLSFLNAFPYDVVIMIVSFWTQQDCLMCMAVCRDWYHMIPQFTHNIWREVQLHSGDIHLDHQRRQRCLGGHVKRVVLHYVTPIPLMQRLVDWDCTEVEDLELCGSARGDQDLFIKLLEQLGSCLTHLALEDHQFSIAIISVLRACPELTHFTYTTTFNVHGIKDEMVEQIIERSSTDPRCTKITYLCLGSNVISKKQIEWTLKRCPELRYFVIVPTRVKAPDSRLSVIDIDSLFLQCPNITLLSFGDNPYQPKKVEYPYNLTGLRYLQGTDNYGRDQLLQCLEKYQGTLEHLSIARHTFDFDWSPVFQSLWLPHLRLLSLQSISFSAASLVAMINRCPTLETLVVKEQEWFVNALSDFQSLHTLDHVVNLHLEHIVIDDHSISTILGRFPALETLSIQDIHISHQVPAHFRCPAQLKTLKLVHLEFAAHDNVQSNQAVFTLFLQQFTRNANMEIVLIKSIFPVLGLEALKKLAVITSLKWLEVEFEPTLSSGDLLEFIRMLSKTKIEHLSLQQACALNFDVLDALAALPLLKTFCAGWTYDKEHTHIDKEGLQRILCTSPSLTTVQLYKFAVMDNDNKLTIDEVRALIQEESQAGNVAHSTSGRWRTREFGGYNYSGLLKRITIERVKQ